MGRQKKRSARELLWFEVAAFGLIIALSWADELLGLPSRLFGGPFRSNIREAILETLVVLLVAVPILIHTRRVVSRPFYFEGFLRVCAWCKNVENHGDWIPVGEFFEERFETATRTGCAPWRRLRRRRRLKKNGLRAHNKKGW
jgi:hypothetical protein